jgi:hypothetical protein
VKIQLAYEYDDHAPDDVIDVDDATGRLLIREGRARTVADSDTKPRRGARPSEKE